MYRCFHLNASAASPSNLPLVHSEELNVYFWTTVPEKGQPTRKSSAYIKPEDLTLSVAAVMVTSGQPELPTEWINLPQYLLSVPTAFAGPLWFF